MSLQTRLTDLATRIGVEIKTVRTEFAGVKAAWDARPGGSFRFLRGDGQWQAPFDYFIVPLCEDETTVITAGTNKYSFRVPYTMTLQVIPSAFVNTASSSGLVTVDINEAGVSILSTKLTIDATETTSATAATPAVLSDTVLAANAILTFDIDTAGTGATGLKVMLCGMRTV